MRRATRTEGVQVLDFSDFSGGLNLLAAPELIGANELVECVNMMYSTTPGRLKTRHALGEPKATFAAEVTGLVSWDDRLLVSSGATLYEYASSGGTPAVLGTLTGAEKPSAVAFGGALYITSGGKLQKLEGTTLTTIGGSPETCLGVYTRAGRIFVWTRGSDSLRGCAVGDPLKWAIPNDRTDADPVEVQIGYKMAGEIVGALPSLRDVLVFKGGGAFRLIGEFPNWSISEISRDECLQGRNCLVDLAGRPWYVEQSKGLRALAGTAGYEQVVPQDALPKVNSWLRHRLTAQTKLWNLRGMNALILTWGEREALYLYYGSTATAPATLTWRFPEPVLDLAELENGKVFVASGKHLFELAEKNGVEQQGDKYLAVASRLVTKRFVGTAEFLVKRVFFDARAGSTVRNTRPMRLYCSGREYLQVQFYEDFLPGVYGNMTPIVGCSLAVFGSRTIERQEFAKHQTLRSRDLQIVIENDGAPFELSRVGVELNTTGVLA